MLGRTEVVARIGLVGLMGMVSLAGCSDTVSSHKTTLFHGATVVTLESQRRTVSAVLVHAGRIVALGNRRQLEAELRRRGLGAGVVRVDLQGATLLPGFVAPHTHPELSAYLHNFVDLSGFTNRTPQEVWSRLERAVRQAPPGAWIFCKGFDPMLVPGLKAPALKYLDSIAPNKPVAIIAQSLHSAWVNTAAFRKVGITRHTPAAAPGSFYHKNKAGQLTGFVVEVAAMQPFMKAALGTMDIKSNIVRVLDGYGRRGITTVATAGLFARDQKPLLLLEHLSTGRPAFKHRALQALGLLPVRKATVRNFVYLKPDTPFLLPERVKNGDDFFRVVGIKLWYDGSPYTGSMYLQKPYLNTVLTRESLGIPPGHRGKSVLPRQKFRAQIKKFHDLGWQLAIHTQGDQAAHDVLNDLAALQKASGKPRAAFVARRHRLEHGLLIPPATLRSLAWYGVSLSFHINHLYYYGAALQGDILGPGRTAGILPTQSALEAGVRITLHADQPMYAEDPLSLLATAVNRKTRAGKIIGASEAVSRQAALRALTIDGAWQLGMEDKLGSIKVGKYADFVVLDKNPLTTPAARLRTLKVLATYVAGRKTF